MNQSANYHLKKLFSFSGELCFSFFPHEISLPRWQHCGVPLLDWCFEENDPMQHPGLHKKIRLRNRQTKNIQCQANKNKNARVFPQYFLNLTWIQMAQINIGFWLFCLHLSTWLLNGLQALDAFDGLSFRVS